MSAENEKLVSDFYNSWTHRNMDEVMSYVTDDVFYHNIPMEPIVGKANARTFLEPFLVGTQITVAGVEIKHTTSSGSLVMGERVDHFVKGSKKFALPVFGVFEIRNSKIAAWRDYFDLGQLNKIME